MNKAELISAISHRYGYTEKESTKQLDQILDVILHSLADGPVKIRGFGTFDIVEREAKSMINPNTKKLTHVPRRNAVVFIPSKRMKNIIRIEGDTHE